MRGLFTFGFIALLLIGGGLLAFGFMDVDVPQTDLAVDIPLPPAEAAAAPTPAPVSAPLAAPAPTSQPEVE
ncbi:MAG: hypothetical protein V4621_04780 [Pseudomonadota bacterium]